MPTASTRPTTAPSATLFEDFTKRAANPKSDATFVYGRPLKGHSWHAKNFADMLREMAEQIKRNTPAGDSQGWAEVSIPAR